MYVENIWKLKSKTSAPFYITDSISQNEVKKIISKQITENLVKPITRDVGKLPQWITEQSAVK